MTRSQRRRHLHCLTLSSVVHVRLRPTRPARLHTGRTQYCLPVFDRPVYGIGQLDSGQGKQIPWTFGSRFVVGFHSLLGSHLMLLTFLSGENLCLPRVLLYLPGIIRTRSISYPSSRHHTSRRTAFPRPSSSSNSPSFLALSSLVSFFHPSLSSPGTSRKSPLIGFDSPQRSTFIVVTSPLASTSVRSSLSVDASGRGLNGSSVGETHGCGRFGGCAKARIGGVGSVSLGIGVVWQRSVSEDGRDNSSRLVKVDLGFRSGQTEGPFQFLPRRCINTRVKIHSPRSELMGSTYLTFIRLYSRWVPPRLPHPRPWLGAMDLRAEEGILTSAEVAGARVIADIRVIRQEA